MPPVRRCRERRRDASVKPEAAERSRADLVAAGVETEHHVFDAGHSLGRAQIAVMREWLARVTAEAGTA